MNDASFRFDATNGGRLASFAIGEFELLHNDPAEHVTGWGCYPMVPFAGRIDSARFRFMERDVALDANQNEHAMHGIGFLSAWETASDGSLHLEFDDRWPFGGYSAQRAVLQATDNGGRLEMELSVTAGDAAMPAMLGWHPWFRRQLTPGGPTAELHVENLATTMEMYEVADNMIPTGTVVAPPTPGPWDHPFRSVEQPLILRWAGQLELSLTSTCDHWVIFDRMDHALCVEPQSGPPDIFNSNRFDTEPEVLSPGDSLEHRFVMEWTLL